MARNRTTIIIIIALLTIVLFLGMQPREGYIVNEGGNTYEDVNINDYATVTLRLGGNIITDGDIITATTFGVFESALICYVDFIGDIAQPDDFEAHLEVDETRIFTDSTPDLVWGTGNNYAFVLELGGSPQGTNPAIIRLTGTYFDWAQPAYGESVGFTIINEGIESFNSPLILTEPIDATIDFDETISLTWVYKYASHHSLTLTDNDGVVLDSQTPTVSTSDITYTYQYTGTLTGTHVIELTINPIADPDNGPVSSSPTTIYVRLGSDPLNYPPSLDHTIITIEQEIVDGSVRPLFYTDWWSGDTRTGSIVESISGTIDVILTAEPADALTNCYIETIIDGQTHTWTLERTDQTDWSRSIDTNNIPEGTYVFEIFGRDKTDGQIYSLGQITVPIRVAPIDLYITPIILFVAFAVIAVVIISRRRR
jgi:hypothetical protein